MKIFDKAKWHIDAGEDVSQVINRMKVIFKFLKGSIYCWFLRCPNS